MRLQEVTQCNANRLDLATQGLVWYNYVGYNCSSWLLMIISHVKRISLDWPLHLWRATYTGLFTQNFTLDWKVKPDLEVTNKTDRSTCDPQYHGTESTYDHQDHGTESTCDRQDHELNLHVILKITGLNLPVVLKIILMVCFGTNLALRVLRGWTYS